MHPLQSRLPLLTVFVLGCGSNASPFGDGGPDGTAGDGAMTDSIAPDTGADSGVNQRPAYDVHEVDRTGCMFGPGDSTVATIGPNVPHGNALPFKHVVFLMMENRSFDHYYSNLPAYGVTDVDVAPSTASNPDPGPPVTMVSRFHETRYCILDTNHEWGGVHLQYDDGKMDGFLVTNNPGGARAMGYYDQTDLPYYYWTAKTFSISDRHFSSLLGPTWPNRFFFYGASAWGRTRTPDIPAINETKITNILENAGRTWKIYRDGSLSFALSFGPKYAGSPMSQFDADVAADALPDLAIMDPNFSAGAGQNDEHPPSNVQQGQKFSKRVLDTLMNNQAIWQKTVFIQTYDEHGGYYDHVAPPAACEPDNIKPPDYAYDRLGVRVPILVASPFAKKGYVSHLVTDLTSITRFIENRFDLPAMTKRDANAWPLLDMFDFEAPPFMIPPTGAPSGDPSQAGLTWCANNPPGTGKP